jgi:hypothetical protein
MPAVAKRRSLAGGARTDSATMGRRGPPPAAADPGAADGAAAGAAAFAGAGAGAGADAGAATRSGSEAVEAGLAIALSCDDSAGRGNARRQAQTQGCARQIHVSAAARRCPAQLPTTAR